MNARAIGTLYLVPTGLGAEALTGVLPTEVCKIAARLDYFVAEHPKSARAFLKQIDAITPLARPLQQIDIATLNVSTAANAMPQLLTPLLEGRDCGLVSEAGCPAVADPGAELVRLAHELGIKVYPLVGPSSIMLGLMASGLNGQSFAFCGYLPTDSAERDKRIRSLESRSAHERQTQLFIETPYRNDVLLAALVAACKPTTSISVASDLTLPSQTIVTRTVSQWKAAPQMLGKRPTLFLLLAASAK